MKKENEPNELLNDGLTCYDCLHYKPDPSKKTLGECEEMDYMITVDHLTKGKNGCLYLEFV